MKINKDEERGVEVFQEYVQNAEVFASTVNQLTINWIIWGALKISKIELFYCR